MVGNSLGNTFLNLGQGPTMMASLILPGHTCQLFLTQRREIFILGVPGFSREMIISEDFRRRPKIFKDIPNNSEVLKKVIMLHTALQKSEISGKLVSFTHFTWTFHFSH